MKTITESLKNICKNTESVIASGDADQINILQTLFRDLESSTREKFQEKLYEPALAIVKKLQLDKDLTMQEKRTLELLIVGDADYYTRIENNFADWLTELRRLVALLASIKGDDDRLSVEELCQLRASARDALNLLPTIAYFVKERNRVEQFREATRRYLEPEDKMMLASIIITALESRTQ